jgi:predicted transcriptional regulator
MDKQTISFRIDAAKVEALDSLAEAMERDRTYLLNEAVTSYLDIQQWQTEQIHKSLRQADADQVVPHAKVKNLSQAWRRS